VPPAAHACPAGRTAPTADGPDLNRPLRPGACPALGFPERSRARYRRRGRTARRHRPAALGVSRTAPGRRRSARGRSGATPPAPASRRRTARRERLRARSPPARRDRSRTRRRRGARGRGCEARSCWPGEPSPAPPPARRRSRQPSHPENARRRSPRARRVRPQNGYTARNTLRSALEGAYVLGDRAATRSFSSPGGGARQRGAKIRRGLRGACLIGVMGRPPRKALHRARRRSERGDRRVAR